DLIWVKDDNKKNTYISAPVTVAKTTKKDVVITLAEATDRHPAQAKLVAEDVIEGKYVTTKKSSAITSSDKSDILSRLSKLEIALKEARQRANQQEVAFSEDIGGKILNYIFGELIKD